MRHLLLSSALALLLFFEASSQFVYSFGNGTETMEETGSISQTESGPSPTPDRSASTSRSVSLTTTESGTFSLDPGICRAEYSVFPLNFNTMPYNLIQGYPEDRIGDVFHFNDLKAVRMQEEGLSVGVRLERGYFFPNVDLPIALKIFTKSQLIESALVPAEQALPAVEIEDKSVESHGLNDYWPEQKHLFKFRRSNNHISLQILPLPGYRIAVDEWVIVLFYFNATAPLGCATKPAVVRITAFRPSWYVPIIGGISLVIMIFGIIAAAAQHTIPSTHHASMVSILAVMHYAQEDGAPVPLALSPFQLTFGTSKYRYVRGAMYGNAGIILISFLGQKLAMWYVARRKGYEPQEAARSVLYPRLTSCVVMHFCGSIMFSCGRNFGNQTSISFLVTSLVLLFTLWVMVKTHRVNVSSTMPFQAEFVRDEVPNSHPLLPPSQSIPTNVDDTFLSSFRSKLTLQSKGHWKSTDTAGSFVPMYGYVFESYKPVVKHWLLIEAIDVSLTALLSVFDNYTPFLAFYQFGVTLLVKIGMLLFLILRKPLLAKQSATAMLANYAGQVIGYLALAIGSLRLELRATAEMVQGIGCTVALLGLMYDVLVHTTTGVFHFYDLYTREKSFEEEDVTHERRLELTTTFRRGKTASELENIERGDKLRFWWDYFGWPAREGISSASEALAAAESIAHDQQQHQESVASPSSGSRIDKNVTLGASIEEEKEKLDLESDRDWIFGKVAERTAELPFYSAMPLWKDLSFAEQTVFFRMLFRGELEPERRSEYIEQRKAEAKAAAAAARSRRDGSSSDDDDDLHHHLRSERDDDEEQLTLLTPAAMAMKAKTEQHNQQLQAMVTNLTTMQPYKGAGTGESTSNFGEQQSRELASPSSTSVVSAAASAASPTSAASTHVNFSHHYDADGIFIDRYHPLYKAQKQAKKEKRDAAAAAAAAANNSSTSGVKGSSSSPLSGKNKNNKPTASSPSVDGVAAQQQQQHRDADVSQSSSNQLSSSARLLSNQQSTQDRLGIDGTRARSRTENALSREWGVIASATEATESAPFLTENDFLSL